MSTFHPALSVVYKNTISGLVVDGETGEPLARAVVTIGGLDIGAETDTLGRYTLTSVLPGLHRVQAFSIGYMPGRKDSVLVDSTSTIRLDFELQEEP